MLGVHVGEQKWDKVEVTDLTGDHGLHYDVMIDVFGEDYLHLTGFSERNDYEWRDAPWTFKLETGSGQHLIVKPESGNWGAEQIWYFHTDGDQKDIRCSETEDYCSSDDFPVEVGNW